MDRSTCESKSREQMDRCDQRCKHSGLSVLSGSFCLEECLTPIPECTKTDACHKLSERMPM
jgi:hypothetical protein